MRKPSSTRVADALRRRILDGSLAPGLQVRQEALAEQFGVSRVPVREALRQLESEGLIHSELHKGAFVSSRTLDEVLEMLDIRIGLELRALQLALPNMSLQTLRQAEQILRRYDASPRPQDWRDLNLAFHLALYRDSRRPRLVRMIEDVVLGTDRFLRAWISATVGRTDPQAEHYRILEACAARDHGLATHELEAHIEHTKAALQRSAAS